MPEYGRYLWHISRRHAIVELVAKTIIFDFDGVIVLSSKPRFDALQKAAKRHGLSIKDDLFIKSIGRITVDFMDQNFPNLDGDTLKAILDDYNMEYKDRIIDHTTPIAFTNDFIREYEGKNTFAIASTNSVATMTVILQHLGLYHYFKLVAGRESASQLKPHPEIYLHTAHMLGVDPSTCIVVEDSPTGALAAKRAGMQVYGLLNGTNSQADFHEVEVFGFLATLSELKTALA